MSGRTGGLLKVDSADRQGVGWSAAYFFFLLASYFTLRPVRETFGIARGPTVLPYLWTGTFVTTLLLTPAFGWLVTRFPRRRFMPVVYHFFAFNVLLFYGLLASLPEGGRVVAGWVFYVWLSAFNAFAVATFWGFMVDLWGAGKGKRVFGVIAAGGTLGALVGAGVTSLLARVIGTPALLLVAAAGLQVTVLCVHRLLRVFAVDSGTARMPARRRVGLRETFSGVVHVGRSPYLLGIVVYLAFDTLTATFLYYEQRSVVYELIATRDARTAYFGMLDFGYNAITLVVEVLLTARILGAIGIAATLAIHPLVNLAGFATIALAPTLVAFGLFEVLRKAVKYSLAKPAREMLFTVLSREDKYKAKSFIDTAVWRGTDMAWIWSARLLEALARSPAVLALVALPATLIWAAAGVLLGRAQERRAES